MVKPELHVEGDQVVGYYPILINGMCLQCHGQAGEEIKAGTLEKLTALYPEDKAKGYKDGGFRGVWVVGMQRQASSN